MNPTELLRLVDSLHREKNIDSELVFSAIESALQTAVKKHFGEESEPTVLINRQSGVITAECNGIELNQEEIGRIGAQTAKQVIIQKIKEAERDSLLKLLAVQREIFRAAPADADKVLRIGLSAPPVGDAIEHAAWSQVARVIINLQEFITRY